MKDGALGKTCSFDVCLECRGSCCEEAKPPLSKYRKRLIKAFLKRQSISIRHPFVEKEYSYPDVDSGGFCVFYEKATKKCIIHQVKPETCVAGPITFDINWSTGKVEWFLKKGEICIFAPKLFQNSERFKEHFQIAKNEIMRLIGSLDSQSLLAILKVEEPETLKIGEDNLPKASRLLKDKLKHK